MIFRKMIRYVLDNIVKLKQLIGAFLGLIVIFTTLSILSPFFLGMSNLLSVARQAAINLIIACGETFVIITGGIDLSSGAVVAFCSVLMGLFMEKGHYLLALVAVLGTGAVAGLFSGIMVTKAKIQPFISTLAVMMIARGLALVMSGGREIYQFENYYKWLGQGFIGPIPTPVILASIICIICAYILRYTVFGRNIYAVGGNEEAALLSGLRVKFVKIMVYTISGLFSGIAAILLMARTQAASPQAGSGYEFDAITAVILGGTSFSGGQGGIMGTIIGALILAMISNGLNLLRVSTFYQQIVRGSIVLLAVWLDTYRRRYNK